MAPMKTTVFLLLAFAYGAQAQRVLQNMASPAAAKPGDNVTFQCIVDQDILNPAVSFCQWARPGGTLVTPGAYPNDEFEYIQYPDSSSDGRRRCDFVLKSVKMEHHGVWQCQPNLQSGPISETGLQPFKFVVASPPEPRRPVIQFNGGEMSEIRVQAGEEIRLTCSLFRTRPRPNFSWYRVSPTGSSYEPIHGMPVVDGEILEPGTDDLRTYNSTITLRVDSMENAMKIRCMANHTMLEDGQNFTDVSLSVQGQASVRQCVKIGSGMSQSIVDNYYCDQRAYYFAGKEAVIEVVFSSNPQPRRVEWVVPKYPGNPISTGETRNGFQAMQWEHFTLTSDDPSLNQLDRPDMYSVKLKITDLSSENVAGRYEVRIFNGIVNERSGEQDYKFKFDVQIGEKPPQGVGTGLIIGIVVALIVVVAIGVVIFAWRTSRMCFAEGGSSTSTSSVVKKIGGLRAKKGGKSGVDVEAGATEDKAEDPKAAKKQKKDKKEKKKGDKKDGEAETSATAANGKDGGAVNPAATGDDDGAATATTTTTENGNKKDAAEGHANGNGTTNGNVGKNTSV